MLLMFYRVKKQFVTGEGSTVDTEVLTEPQAADAHSERLTI